VSITPEAISRVRPNPYGVSVPDKPEPIVPTTTSLPVDCLTMPSDARVLGAAPGITPPTPNVASRVPAGVDATAPIGASAVKAVNISAEYIARRRRLAEG